LKLIRPICAIFGLYRRLNTPLRGSPALEALSTSTHLRVSFKGDDVANHWADQLLSNEIHINLFNGSYEGRNLLKGTSLINPTFD